MESEKPTSSRKVTSDDPASDRDRSKRKASKKSSSSTDPTKAKKPKQKNYNGALSPVSKKRKGDKPTSRRRTNGDDSDEESIDDSLKGYADRMPEVCCLFAVLVFFDVLFADKNYSLAFSRLGTKWQSNVHQIHHTPKDGTQEW
jgi:hypothetical protein